MYFVSTFICFYFMLSSTGVLYLLEELCITQVAAINSFSRVLNSRVQSVMCQLKSSSADQDILMEWNQLRFIFQHCLLAVYTFLLAVLQCSDSVGPKTSWTFSLLLYIYIMLVTIVEGDPKAPFLLASTLRCWGGCYTFSWIAPLHPWSIPYNAKC